MSTAINLQMSIIILTSGAVLGSLESAPLPIYDSSGTPLLIACAGDQISLTCNFDNRQTGVTLWTFNPGPLDCNRRTIDHNNPNNKYSCGPFVFENITSVRSAKLSSTAVATANNYLSNTVVECRDNTGINYNQSATIKLCIVDESSISGNVSIVNTTNGTEIHWDPVHHTDCATNYTTVSYTVRVTRADGHEEGQVVISGETSAVIFDLKPQLEYKVSVRAMVVVNTGNHSCDILGSYAVLTFLTPSDDVEQQIGGLNPLLLWVIPLVVCSCVLIIVVVCVVVIVLCFRRNAVHKT